jgi:AcrR family transcriptional regulator
MKVMPVRRFRLAPDARRLQLVRAAAKLLDEKGPAYVQFQEVADRAKVTRPVVYRFFPSRDDLIEGILDDFVTALAARYHEALVNSMGGSLPEMVGAFIEASADAIEERGPGAWRLLYSRGNDTSAARLGRAAMDRLLEPWMPRVAELTGLKPVRVRLCFEVFVAAGGAALDGWLDGRISRKQAVALATRTVSALLAEFAREP